MKLFRMLLLRVCLKFLAVTSGQSCRSRSSTGRCSAPSMGLMMAGRDATDADIERFISAYNTLAMSPPSEEMQSFSKIYIDGGKTLASWFEGVKANPTILPQLFVFYIHIGHV